eukprot:TRINITY_DN59974_c0_g1_i1.p1 TRINITY_DN59974_c0_g1~~TRINITY_DN59974_c0_g1_i1.p1  ORF type:complete len:313 (+),score=54.64 TRINITY_DN59974_c0_g1_i1:78-941(+)
MAENLVNEQEGSKAKIVTAVVQQRGSLAKKIHGGNVLFNEDSFALPNDVVVRWSQVAMVSVSLADGGRRFVLVLGSADHHVYDYIEMSLPMEPAAAGFVQMATSKEAAVSTVSRSLTRWPLRTMYGAGMSFRQVYWFHAIFSNAMELMFGLMFFTTLQRKLSRSGEDILDSLGKLQEDVVRIFFGSEGDNPARGLETTVFASVFQMFFGSWMQSFALPLLIPLKLAWLLLDFHTDIVVLCMLLPHVFMFWQSIMSLTYAINKACKLLLRAGQVVKSASGPVKREKAE